MTPEEMADAIIEGLDGAYDFKAYAQWHRSGQLIEDVAAIRVAASVLRSRDMTRTAQRLDFFADLLARKLLPIAAAS